MSEFDQQWQKLVALARQAPDSREVQLPYGFATRVASRAGEGLAPWAPLERFAVRGFLAAAACCVAAVAFNFLGLSVEASPETQMEETLNTVLELS